MRKDIAIVAEPRTTRGKNEARRLRAAGRIPAVVYGSGKETAAVSLDPLEVNRILFSGSGHNTIINVELDGEGATPAMIVAWQHDPVKDDLLHVDLERIDLTKKITVRVPVRTQGEPVGVKTQGGLLELVHREVEVECLPDDIPEFFAADVSEMVIGDTLRANELPIDEEKITLKGKLTMVICHVIELRAAVVEEEEAEEGAEEAPAEGEETEEKKE